jgi:DNA-binding PadR family transcriptional regulator
MDQTMSKRNPRPLRSRPTVTFCGWRIQQRPDLVDALKDISLGLWGRSFSASEANLALLYGCSIRNAQALRKRLTLSGYVDVRDGVMRIGDSGRRLMIARYPEPQIDVLMHVTERMVREALSNEKRAVATRAMDDFAGVIGGKRFAVLAHINGNPGQGLAAMGRIMHPEAKRPEGAMSAAVIRLVLRGLVEKIKTAGRDTYEITDAGRAKLAEPGSPTQPVLPLKHSPLTIRGKRYDDHAAAAADLKLTPEAIARAQRRGRLDRVGMVGDPVEIDGQIYASKTAAAEAVGVSRRTFSQAMASRPTDQADEPVARLRKRAPITIRGTVYASTHAAAEALGVAVKTINMASLTNRLDTVGLGRHRKMEAAE